MAKINVPREAIYTHEGAKAQHINPELQLRRSVMACMLWESGFYESGEEVAERIASLIPKVAPEKVSAIAVEAREKMNLRHVPLLIVREMARHNSHKPFVKGTLERIIQRADELAEFLALYWKDGKTPLSAQVKKGLAAAFQKFSPYQLAKYNREGIVKLRDVLFLCHAKPKDDDQAAVWKKLVEGTLEPPDTWEVALSSGSDKKETWVRLLSENKLGALALLRNLRNMEQAGVDRGFIRLAISRMNPERVLPFRFISAAKAVPGFEDALDSVFLSCLSTQEKLPGKTVIVVDVSGSMYGGLVSKNSDMNRALAGCALAAIAREVCAESAIYATAGNDRNYTHATAMVPNRHGMALVDAIYSMCRPLGGGGVFVNQVCSFLKVKETSADRIIIITDEQDCDLPERKINPDLSWVKSAYMLNVATDRNGVGYGPWTHIDGWSEAVIDYIREVERNTETN